MRPEELDPAYTSPWGFAIIGAIILVTLAWSYGPGIVRELRGHHHRLPMAVEDYSGQRKVFELSQRRHRSHAYPAKKTDRWPLKGLDRFLSNIFRGGSISGF